MLNNNQGSKNMNITKYIKTPLASEVELLSYKLLLNCQITDAQDALILIEKQLKKIGQFAIIKKPKKASGVVGVDFRKSLDIS